MSGQILAPRAEFIFNCEMRGGDDCYRRWFDSKKYKKLLKKYEDSKK